MSTATKICLFVCYPASTKEDFEQAIEGFQELKSQIATEDFGQILLVPFFSVFHHRFYRPSKKLVRLAAHAHLQGELQHVHQEAVQLNHQVVSRGGTR